MLFARPAARDWRQPWVAGNEAMFLAILLVHDRDLHGMDAAARALEAWFAFHDQNQDPATGFWGEGRTVRTLDGMGGAMHQFLIYWREGRPLARLPGRLWVACAGAARSPILTLSRKHGPTIRRSNINKNSLISTGPTASVYRGGVIQSACNPAG